MEIEDRQRRKYDNQMEKDTSLESLEGLFEYEDYEHISELRALLDKYL